MFLKDQYEVYIGNDTVGKVQLIRQGLYIRVICRCEIPNDQVMRLFVLWDDHRENLGVVVPGEDGFILDRKVPAKRLGEGSLRFVLSSGSRIEQGTFIPISPEEPFHYIDRLKNSFLQSEHGKIGIRTEQHPEAV